MAQLSMCMSRGHTVGYSRLPLAESTYNVPWPQSSSGPMLGGSWVRLNGSKRSAVMTMTDWGCWWSWGPLIWTSACFRCRKKVVAVPKKPERPRNSIVLFITHVNSLLANHVWWRRRTRKDRAIHSSLPFQSFLTHHWAESRMSLECAHIKKWK